MQGKRILSVLLVSLLFILVMAISYYSFFRAFDEASPKPVSKEKPIPNFEINLPYKKYNFFDYSKIVYVSKEKGSDQNNGLSWAKAKATISSAINEIQDEKNPLIAIQQGDYQEPTLKLIGQKVTIAGGYSGNEEVIDPDNKPLKASYSSLISTASRLIEASYLPLGNQGIRLFNLRMRNGNAGYQEGGCIALVDIVALMQNLSFENCRATDGGAIAMKAVSQRPYLIASNLEFKNNIAVNRGGAVFFDTSIESSRGGALFFTASKLLGNQAGLAGGGVFLNGGFGYFVRNYFEKHTADNGGAVHIDGANIRLIGNVARENLAKKGGAFYMERLNSYYKDPKDINVFIANEFYANQADIEGGGVYLANTFRDGYFTQNFFTQNKAPKGSALYLRDGIYPSNITTNVFSLNEADYGTIHLAGNLPSKKLASNTISDNLAYRQGLAINIPTGINIESAANIISFNKGSNAIFYGNPQDYQINSWRYNDFYANDSIINNGLNLHNSNVYSDPMFFNRIILNNWQSYQLSHLTSLKNLGRYHWLVTDYDFHYYYDFNGRERKYNYIFAVGAFEDNNPLGLTAPQIILNNWQGIEDTKEQSSRLVKSHLEHTLGNWQDSFELVQNEQGYHYLKSIVFNPYFRIPIGAGWGPYKMTIKPTGFLSKQITASPIFDNIYSLRAFFTAGDINNDDEINLLDLMVALNNFAKNDRDGSLGDTNGNQLVEIADISNVLNSFGKKGDGDD